MLHFIYNHSRECSDDGIILRFVVSLCGQWPIVYAAWCIYRKRDMMRCVQQKASGRAYGSFIKIRGITIDGVGWHLSPHHYTQCWLSSSGLSTPLFPPLTVPGASWCENQRETTTGGTHVPCPIIGSWSIISVVVGLSCCSRSKRQSSLNLKW